jgi:GntR family transcriptional regulator
VAIEFRLETRTGVAPYLQLVHQVKHALRLGMLEPGDQIPTVKEVVGALAINPNTVLKAYRELEHEGLVAGRPGLGTFVTASLAHAPVPAQAALRRSLLRWLGSARSAGMDDEGILALFASTFRDESHRADDAAAAAVEEGIA